MQNVLNKHPTFLGGSSLNDDCGLEEIKWYDNDSKDNSVTKKLVNY